jgi:hypothetical protein
MASPKPAVIVRREFEATPDVVSQQLRACIVGPSAQLVRYGKAGEKANGLVATLASDPAPSDAGVSRWLRSADLLYSIPGIDYTSLLDESYCKVYADDAYLTWAHIAHGSILLSQTVSLGANSLTCASSSGWKANVVAGTTYARNGSLPQDVAIGDIVQIYNSSGLAHTSTVTGFDGSVTSASKGIVNNSITATVAAETTSPVSLSGVLIGTGGATYTVNLGSYLAAAANFAADPRQVGKLSTTYTVTITDVPSPSTISYTVASDTGIDSLSVFNVASGSTQTLPSGATIALTFTTGQLVAGNSTTFTINVQHTRQRADQSGEFAVAGSLSASAPDTTYVLTCIQGGAFSSTNSLAANQPKFRVSTINGADLVSTVTFDGTGAQSGLAIGSYGLALTWSAPGAGKAKGFVKGDYFTVKINGASVTFLNQLVFADPAPAITATAVRLSKRDSVQIPKYWANFTTPNWAIVNGSDSDLRRLRIDNLITVRHPAIGSGLVDAYVTAGKFYLEYRAFQALPREVGSVQSLSDITTQLGTIDPDNPLAYGVYKAWSNANGATVHYIGTISQELNGNRGFADALALAQGNRNCYGLVPLTTSSEIWSAFAGHAKDESDPTVGRFRIVWFAPELEQHFKSLDKDIFGADIYGVSSLHGSGKYELDAKTVLGAVSSANFTQTVQPGDFVRTSFGTNVNGNATYVEYKIAAVLDNSTLLLNTTTNPLLVSGADRIEIYRNLTSSALATKYVQVAGGFSSERVYAVVPDRGINGLRVDGVPVRNWYVACAFAGLRSGSVPQQPLSNVELVGFDGLTTVDQLFDEPDLDILRDGGVWVVRKAEDGRIYSERQLSTSTLDIYRKEQSVTTNVDSIAFALADGLRNLVGRVNITEGTRGLVEATIRQILGQFTATNGAVTTGPQLLSYTVVSVTVPATAKDTLVVKVQIEVPLPMNIIDITLVI